MHHVPLIMEASVNVPIFKILKVLLFIIVYELYISVINMLNLYFTFSSAFILNGDIKVIFN